MIPSQGFTFEGFSRGLLGIITVLVIAYIFSNQKNKIAELEEELAEKRRLAEKEAFIEFLTDSISD